MNDDRPDRRAFVGRVFGVATAGVAGLAAVRLASGGPTQGSAARLRARPGSSSRARLPAGRTALPQDAGPDAFVHVPAAVAGSEDAAPVLVLLHGATRAFPGLDRMVREAERRNVVVVVPMAEHHTWDLMIGRRYAGDVARIDAALEAVFAGVPADPRRLCLAGFSDGASYALSVGLQNGDLFSHLIAFSPGFIGPGRPIGEPRVFVSHGRSDGILPIETTGARVAASLEQRGLEHRYREFDGGHSMPDAVRAEALDWFLGPAASGA